MPALLFVFRRGRHLNGQSCYQSGHEPLLGILLVILTDVNSQTGSLIRKGPALVWPITRILGRRVHLTHDNCLTGISDKGQPLRHRGYIQAQNLQAQRKVVTVRTETVSKKQVIKQSSASSKYIFKASKKPSFSDPCKKYLHVLSAIYCSLLSKSL